MEIELGFAYTAFHPTRRDSKKSIKNNVLDGRGIGQVASVLAIYSVDLSMNPVEVYSFIL